MTYTVAAVAAMYGVLSVVAAIAGVKQGKKGDASAMMLIGGCLLISAAGLRIFHYGFDWIGALCGSILISIAAYMNGKRGEFHAGHHIIRAVVEVAIVVGLILL